MDPQRCANVRAAMKRVLADPAERERRRAISVVNINRARTFVDPKRCGASRTERVLGWCPAERRDEYRRLRNMFGAAEARRILSEDIDRTHARSEGAAA